MSECCHKQCQIFPLKDLEDTSLHCSHFSLSTDSSSCDQIPSLSSSSLTDLKEFYFDDQLPCPLPNNCQCHPHSNQTKQKKSNFILNKQEKKKYYSLEEVKQHNSPLDCWLIVNHTIFDVTYYLACHPAGPMTILNRVRKSPEVTQDFYFHSDKAKKLWKQLPMVGYLDQKSRKLLKQSHSCCLQ